jgi:hypothetical protein
LVLEELEATQLPMALIAFFLQSHPSVEVLDSSSVALLIQLVALEVLVLEDLT